MTQKSQIDKSPKNHLKNDIKLAPTRDYNATSCKCFQNLFEFAQTCFPQNSKIRPQGLTVGVSSNFEGIKFWTSKMSQFDQKFHHMANRHQRSRK